jgi:hypothetical protein
VCPFIQALAVLAIAGTAAWRIWMAYRTTVIQEKERTSRMSAAINGASPAHRPDIIRACSLLEGTAPGSPTATPPSTADTPTPGRYRTWWLRPRRR